MPESKGRDKAKYTPPPVQVTKAPATNPPWFVPVMVGLMVVGLLWVAAYYISGAKEWPVPPLAFGRGCHYFGGSGDGAAR